LCRRIVKKLARYQNLLQSGAIYLSQLAPGGPQVTEELEVGLIHLSMLGGAAAEELASGIELLVNLDAAYKPQGTIV